MRNPIEIHFLVKHQISSGTEQAAVDNQTLWQWVKNASYTI